MNTPEHSDPSADPALSPSSDEPTRTAGATGASGASHATAQPAPAPAPAPVLPPQEPAGATRPDPAAEDAPPRAPEDRRTSADAFPVPTGPRTTSFGGHLLGLLLGLALTILAGVLITLGQSRILAAGVGRSDITPETLGIVLVTLGALVVGLVVLLGLWTPAAPFTGGLLAAAVGAAYLFAPVEAHRATVRLIATQQNRTAVLNSITVGTTGGLFLTGVVLLAAATAFSLVRRRGLALGAFRERSHGGPVAH
jgi:hypothetical protein